MTLFASALRTDRLPASGTPTRSAHGIRSAVKRLFARPRPFAMHSLAVVTPQAKGTHHERPEPHLAWTDPHTPPVGDFVASAILNAELDTAVFPRRGDSWEAVSDFALSYDGYRYWDDLHELASGVLQRWTRSRSLPGTLDEVRGCLFYEQRRWHHFGEDPTGRSAEYMWALIDAISARAGRSARAERSATPARVDDPRRAVAPEAHVQLVHTRAVSLRPVPSRAVKLRAVPRRVERLVPVAANEAHVRLISAIEGEASSVSRHPAGSARQNWTHPALHPSTTAPRDLWPMPSAEPLPKPPVITRRPHRTDSATSDRPGTNGSRANGSGTNGSSANGSSANGSSANGSSANGSRANGSRNGVGARRPSNGARPRSDSAPNAAPPASADVTPLCREFCGDDAGYRAWVGTHPDGYVLNAPPGARSAPPTLHRVGCAALARRSGNTGPLTAQAVKVCGPSAEMLGAWSEARGSQPPKPCARCLSSR
jgi:hypothetical protein